MATCHTCGLTPKHSCNKNLCRESLPTFYCCPWAVRHRKEQGLHFYSAFIQQSVWAMDNRDFMMHLNTPHKLGSYFLNGHKRCLKPDTVLLLLLLLFFVSTSLFLHYSFFIIRCKNQNSIPFISKKKKKKHLVGLFIYQ